MTSIPPPSTSAGRPRDPRIDSAVLEAATSLLEEVGYLRLTMGAIAERAGTTKPAIYRRWPTKAHLVHEAVFPSMAPDVLTGGDDLRADIRSLLAVGIEGLMRPAARAAVPGLLAEMTANPDLHAEVLERFAHGTWGCLQDRIERAIDAGEVRRGVRSSTVLELIAGSAFIATSLRPLEDVGEDWLDDVADLIVRGIAS